MIEVFSRLLFDHCTEPLIITDYAGRIIEQNPEFNSFLNKYNSGTIQKSISNYLNKSSDRFLQNTQKKLQPGHKESIDLVFKFLSDYKFTSDIFCIENGRENLYLIKFYQETRAKIDTTEQFNWAESSNVFKKILDAVPVRIFWKDQLSVYIGCNQQFAKDAGVNSPDEVIGKTDFEFRKKEEAQKFRLDDKKVIDSGKPLLNIEEFQTMPNGDLRWIKTSKIPFKDNKDNIIGIIGIYEDISEKRLMLRQVQAKNFQQEKLLNTAWHLSESLKLPEVMKMIVDGIMELLNTHSCTIYLLEPDAKTLKPMIVRDPDYEQELMNTNLDVENSLTGQAVKKGKGIIFNSTGTEAGGFHIPGTPDDLEERLIATPLKFENKIIGAVCLSRFKENFSEQELSIVETFAAYASAALKNAQLYSELQNEIEKHKATEKNLQELNVQYRTFFENSVIGIFRLEFKKPISIKWKSRRIAEAILNNGYFTDCNDTFAQMYNYDSKEQMIGKMNDELIANYEGSVNRLEKFVNNGFKVESIISEEKNNQGEIKNFDNSYFGVIENNKLKWIWGIQADITEKLHLESLLLQAQKMDAIGRLAGGIAHDFNNLLTVINGHAEIGKALTPRDEKLNKKFDSILQAGNRAGDLTKKLLGFSRKQVIEPKVFEIHGLINNFISMSKRLIGEHIKVVKELSEEKILIKADQGQIEQILINLFVNARDAINEKSSRTKKKEIRIKTDKVFIDSNFLMENLEGQPGWHAMISVNDSGDGMDKMTQSRIFEPFFTTKPVGQGTGLGMSTVYGIIKQNNGQIFIDSTKGIGTTFSIYWPLDNSGLEPDSEQKSDPKSARGKERILIVEDEEAVRDLITTTLSELGYQIYTAEDGAEALHLVRQKKMKLDLLITDIIMPEINGTELAEKLKKIYPELKILFASGYTDDPVFENELVDEKLNFIPKPFSIQALTDKVRVILDS